MEKQIIMSYKEFMQLKSDLRNYKDFYKKITNSLSDKHLAIDSKTGKFLNQYGNGNFQSELVDMLNKASVLIKDKVIFYKSKP